MSDKTIDKKSINIVVAGLENLDQAKAASENKVNILKNKHKKDQIKEKIKRFLLLCLGAFELMVTILLSILQENTSSAISVFAIGLGFVVLTAVFAIMPNKKMINEQNEANGLIEFINYIERQKNTFNILLEKKDQLIDVYLKPYNEDWIFSFVTLIRDDSGYEEVKTFNIYIDKLKIFSEGNYTSFIVEPFDKEKFRYEIQLEIIQDTYEKIISRK